MTLAFRQRQKNVVENLLVTFSVRLGKIKNRSVFTIRTKWSF